MTPCACAKATAWQTFSKMCRISAIELPASAYLVEPFAVHQFHRVINAAVRKDAGIVNGDDPWMLEASDDPGLLLHSHSCGGVGIGRKQDLERHFAIEIAVACPVDGGHAALADLLDDLVFRAGQIGPIGHPAQMIDNRVRQPSHSIRPPNRRRDSSRNSSSLPVVARIRSRTSRRNSRRIAAR